MKLYLVTKISVTVLFTIWSRNQIATQCEIYHQKVIFAHANSMCARRAITIQNLYHA